MRGGDNVLSSSVCVGPQIVTLHTVSYVSFTNTVTFSYRNKTGAVDNVTIKIQIMIYEGRKCFINGYMASDIFPPISINMTSKKTLSLIVK